MVVAMFFACFEGQGQRSKVISIEMDGACICSAQSKNRYTSGTVLRKVGIFTLSANSGIVPDNSRIAQGIYVENR